MIPLIHHTCLRVPTPTTASASAGPDAYPLVSTVNLLYLHASPSLPTAFFHLSHLSLFPLLSCRCHYSVLHPRGNLRCQLYAWLVACYYGPEGLERDRRYRINGPKGAAIGDEPLFGSDLRFAV